MTFSGELRIGDAERETAMAALREHYAQGRLTHEELDERLELVLSARTGRDLTAAFADLPGPYGSGTAESQGPGDIAQAWQEYGEHWAHMWAGHRRHRGRERGRNRAGWASHPASWPGPPALPDPAMLRQLAAWRQFAARHHRGAGRRGGHPAFPLVIALVAVVAITGFWTFKFLLFAWLTVAVVGVLRHRHRHHRMHARARRIGSPGAL